MFKEVHQGDHHRVSKTTKMSTVTHFLGENISGVDEPWDVFDVDRFGTLLLFSDSGFTKVDVFCALDGLGLGPDDGSLVVIVDGSSWNGVGHAQIKCSMAEPDEFHNIFVCGHNFGLT